MKQKKYGKPYEAIVEYVFNACSFNLYIPELELISKVNLNHISTPSIEK